MEAFCYDGIPTSEEIKHRIEFGNTQLGFMQTCPFIDCQKTNSQFLRETYWLCHSCSRLFTTQDAIKFRNERSEILNKYGYYSEEYSKYRTGTSRVIRHSTSTIKQQKTTDEFNKLKEMLKGM